MRPIVKGSTDQSTVFRFVDSADGTPETGVSDATAGLALWYRREGGLKVAITPASLAALNTAHTDGGVEHISDGYVRIDPPDAAFATGANGVAFGGSADGMVVIGSYHQLTDVNPYDAVRGGMTALPNAAADAAGGLPISDAGGLDLDAKIGALTYGTANRVNAQVYGMEANTVTASAVADGAIDAGALAADAITAAKIADGAIDAATFAAGAINAAAIASDAITDAKVASDVTIASVTGAVGSVTGNVGGSVASIATGGISAASFAAGAIDAAALAADAGTEIGTAVWATTTRLLTAGTNIVLAKGTGVTGFNDLSAAQVNAEADTAITDAALATAANLATVAGYLDTEIAAILTDTNELQTDWADGGRLDLILDARASQTSVDTIDDLLDTEVAAIKTDTAAIKLKTDNIPAAPASTGDVTGVWTTAMTEAYAADGATMTPAQALYMILATVSEFSISGTTITAKKLDGSTTAMTWTLDSSSSPTSRTRAS